MKQRLLLVTATLMVLLGWFSAFMLNSVPHQSTLYIIGPTLLLGVGMGILRKNSCWKKTALAVLFSALTALLIMNQFFPDRQVTVSAVKQRFQESQAGKVVAISVKDADGHNTFVADRRLEKFAPIEVQLYAQLPGEVRMLTTDTAGNIYVTIPALGAIYRLTDNDADGFADESILYHVGMDRPHGIVWDNGKLYVAEPSQLLELSDTNNNNQVDQVRIVVSDLPDDGGHWQRSLAKGRDGNLYLGIGSRCNVCEEADSRRATVLKIDPTTGATHIFAKGLRNTIGLTFSPDGNILWGSDIGRSGLGSQLPPDEINRLVADGDYGWPFCYGKQEVDPLLGSADRCASTVASSIDLPSQSTPMGIAFGEKLSAPDEYQNSMYVVLHGSSSENKLVPGKVIRIPYQQQKLATHGKEFLRGWEFMGKSWGQPVAIIVGSDGNLYLSDAKAQAIYRISWQTVE